MLVAFSSLLRRHRPGSVRHQLTGASLQSAAEFVSVDLLCGDGYEERCLSTRSFSDGAAASTSSCVLPSGKSFTSVHASGSVFGCFGLTARHASSSSESHTARRREILRDAAQKVLPGSTWLLAYSHNIDPRQLTYRLGKRSTLHALQEGWALYQQKFDTIAMAALLRRLRVAQLYDPDFDAASAQRLLNALEPRLRSVTIRFGKLRDTIAYLHALAKLRSPPPKAPARGVAGLPEDSSAGNDSFDNDAVTAIAAASSVSSSGGAQQLGQPADLVLDLAAWATRDRTQVLHASPRRLSTLLWALLRTVPPEQYGNEKLQMVLDRVALCSIRQWRNFAPQDTRIFAVAYATFGPRAAAQPAAAPATPAAATPAAATPATTTPATATVAAAAGPDGSISRSWLGSASSWPQPEGKRAPAASGAGAEPAAAAVAAGSGTSAAAGGDADARAKGSSSGRGGEAEAAQRLKRNALVLQVAADHLVARVGDLTASQPEPRDLALTAHAWALQGGPAPHLALLVRAAGAAAAEAANPHAALQPLEQVLLVEALAQYGVRQPVLMNAVRRRAAEWTRASAEHQELRGRLAKAYKRLGVSL